MAAWVSRIALPCQNGLKSTGLLCPKGICFKNILRYPRNGDPISKLVQFSEEGHPSVSPNQKYIATDYHKSGRQAGILIQDIKTKEEFHVLKMGCPIVEWQTLHPPKSPGHIHPVWSHDGRILYFNAYHRDMPIFCALEIPSLS
jgi:Tol biopolymer transport system component